MLDSKVFMHGTCCLSNGLRIKVELFRTNYKFPFHTFSKNMIAILVEIVPAW